MKNILTVISKEFARFFRDKRLVLGTLILPGLLIFVLYTLMGSAFNSPSETVYTAKVVNPSSDFASVLELAGGDVMTLEEADASQIDAIKEEISAGENFDSLLDPSLPPLPVGSAPNVELWFDSSSGSSASAYNFALSLLETMEESVSNRFDVNLSAGGDLTTVQEAVTSYYAMLLPFLILTFLYSGCMGIAPESIAGEKERGTIATLLVTPIKRSELVVGKIVSLSALSALSAISSFIGTFLSMPKLMGGNIGDMFAAYSAGQYVALFAIMLSAVLLIVSLISILSALAKSVKEASTFAVPLMIVVMLVGLSSMLFTTGNPAAYLIPVFNCVQVMSAIFSMQFSAVNLLIALGSNLVYIALLVYVLTRMFKSERVMFNR